MHLFTPLSHRLIRQLCGRLVVVPRPLNNFLDNLPSEERLASDGPWTLFEPAKKFIIETKDDISEKGKGSFSLVLWLKTDCFSSA